MSMIYDMGGIASRISAVTFSLNSPSQNRSLQGNFVGTVSHNEPKKLKTVVGGMGMKYYDTPMTFTYGQ